MDRSIGEADMPHPNKIGHERMGNILTRKVGAPSVRTVQGATPNDDVPNPEIRETVSAWIQDHYARQIGKPLTLRLVHSHRQVHLTPELRRAV